MAKTTPEFDAALATWLEGCNRIVAENDARFEHVKFNSRVEVEGGRKYLRVVKRDDCGGGSAWAFVDTTNGDVLKPASWKAPAKHARGNIYDAQNGLGSIGPYGPAYLR